MKKDNIIIILSLLALILIVFLLVLPAFDALNMASASLSFEEEQFAQIQAQSQKLSALEKKYKDNPGELEKLKLAVPEEEDLSGLLINLENLAAANNLVMGSVNFKAAEKKLSIAPPQIGDTGILPGENQGLADAPSAGSVQPMIQTYKITAVTIDLAGGYNSFKDYLKGVEGNERLMDVISFNYSRGESSQGSDSYKFGLNLNVYYQ